MILLGGELYRRRRTTRTGLCPKSLAACRARKRQEDQGQRSLFRAQFSHGSFLFFAGRQADLRLKVLLPSRDRLIMTEDRLHQHRHGSTLGWIEPRFGGASPTARSLRGSERPPRNSSYCS